MSFDVKLGRRQTISGTTEKMHNLINNQKTSANPNWRTFYKLTSSPTLENIKIKIDKGLGNVPDFKNIQLSVT